MSRRFLAVALTILLTSLFLAACKADDADSDAAQPLPIVAGGVTDYVVVRNDLYDSSNPIVRTAVRLRNTISEVTGAEMQIKTDWDGTEDNSARKEILVGDTNRQESKDALAQLRDDQFIIKVCGDGTKIVVTGKTERGTEAAVDYFCQTYLGYRSGDDFTANPDFSLSLGLEDIRGYDGSAGEIIPANSDSEAALIWQDAGTVSDGKRTLARTDVLIYRMHGMMGKPYKLTFDIEGQYLVTVSTDNETYYRLFAFTDDGYGSPRGNYTADLTEYFATSETVYIRVTDYHPLDENSPVIYSLSLTDEDRTLD
jgi:hypothetical protein